MGFLFNLGGYSSYYLLANSVLKKALVSWLDFVLISLDMISDRFFFATDMLIIGPDFDKRNRYSMQQAVHQRSR